jgi:plastocyanin
VKKRSIFIIIVIIILLVIGAFIFIKKSSSIFQTNKTSAPAPLTQEQTVTLTKKGFTPKEITIKTGTSIHWINKLGERATVNSDNYPTNQLHKEINLGIFANDSSLTHIFTQPGSFGYHDQFQPNFKGTIIVKK